MGQARRGRESSGRERDDRRGGGGEGAAGRILAAGRRGRDLHQQPESLQQPAIRSDQGIRADHDTFSYGQVLAIHPSVPATTLTQLIALAKARPGALSYGSFCSGSGAHLNMEAFKLLNGLDLVHVPYKGAAPAITGLLAGRLAVVFVSAAQSEAPVKAGKLRAPGIAIGGYSVSVYIRPPPQLFADKRDRIDRHEHSRLGQQGLHGRSCRRVLRKYFISFKESHIMKKLLILMIPLLLAPAVAFGQTAPNPKRELRVALILPGSVTDGTFNAAADKGIKAAQKRFPNIKVSVRENTAFAQMEEAFLSYARDGYDVAIGHGFQFAEPAVKVHKQFPKTWFIVNTAKVAGAPNLASYDNRWGDVGYVAGFVAALTSKSGVIGNIGGIPVPVIQEYSEGFERGAKRSRPGVRVLSAYVGSFSDIAKGKEITLSLIEQGADVVTATGNESLIGTVQAARERKVRMISTAFDSAALAPETIVTTALVNFDVNLVRAIGAILDGTIKPQNYLLGFNEDAVGLAGFGKFDSQVSAADKQRIRQLINDIKEGKVADLPAIR